MVNLKLSQRQVLSCAVHHSRCHDFDPRRQSMQLRFCQSEQCGQNLTIPINHGVESSVLFGAIVIFNGRLTWCYNSPLKTVTEDNAKSYGSTSSYLSTNFLPSAVWHSSRIMSVHSLPNHSCCELDEAPPFLQLNYLLLKQDLTLVAHIISFTCPSALRIQYLDTRFKYRYAC